LVNRLSRRDFRPARVSGRRTEVEERRMSVLRTKCLSTKLTADEWAAIAQAAAGDTLSGWARAVLLEAAAAPRADHLLLAEVLAVRALVLHLHVAAHTGETLTTEQLQRLIARVDADTRWTAQERLGPVPAGRRR
jgi:hypothetical protein